MNINNYSEMSIEDLEKLKIKYLSQRDNASYLKVTINDGIV